MSWVPLRPAAPDEDVLHEASGDGAWSEHHYFFFADARTGLAGGCRIAWRVEEEQTQGFVFCFMPDGVCLWQHREGDERLRAGPLHFDGGALGDWSIGFEADALALSDPLALSGLRDVDGVTRAVRLGWDLRFTPVSPAVEADPSPAVEDFVTEIAPRRLEQAGRYEGTVTIDGDERRVEGFGTRDHSWGVRRAEGLEEWKWCTIPLGDDLCAGAGHVRFDRGEIVSGWLSTGGELLPVEGASVVFEPDATGVVPRHVRVVLETRSGRRSFEGTVACPLGVRVAEHGRSVVAVESLTRYTSDDGRQGWGIAEYVRAV